MNKITLLLLTCICSTLIINASAGKFINFAKEGQPADERWVSEYVANTIFTKEEHTKLLSLANAALDAQKITAELNQQSKNDSKEYSQAAHGAETCMGTIMATWNDSVLANVILPGNYYSLNVDGALNTSVEKPNTKNLMILMLELTGRDLAVNKGEELAA